MQQIPTHVLDVNFALAHMENGYFSFTCFFPHTVPGSSEQACAVGSIGLLDGGFIGRLTA